MPLPDKIDVTWRRLPRRAMVDKRDPPPGTLDYGAYLKRHAAPGDWTHVIDEPCILHDGNPANPTVVYMHLKDYGLDLTRIAKACESVRFAEADRTDGMLSISRVFGYEPRNPIRKDYCGPTSLSDENPEAHDAICELAQICNHFYRMTNPHRWQKHMEVVQTHPTVKPWLLLGKDGKPTVFTSGIANKNNLLPYHYDRGNFEDVWSAMIVFKGGPVEGGWLSVPEYDAAFTLPDHSLFMFDGQNLMHGVTPFTILPGGYRYSLVYYSLKGMWQCLTPGEVNAELARYQAKKWERQERRIAAEGGSDE